MLAAASPNKSSKKHHPRSRFQQNLPQLDQALHPEAHSSNTSSEHSKNSLTPLHSNLSLSTSKRSWSSRSGALSQGTVPHTEERNGVSGFVHSGELSDKVRPFVVEVRRQLEEWEVGMYARNRTLVKIPAERLNEQRHLLIREMEQRWRAEHRPFTTPESRLATKGQVPEPAGTSTSSKRSKVREAYVN